MLSFLEPSSPFEPPSILFELVSSPLKLMVRFTYRLVLFLRGPSIKTQASTSSISLVIISDTHNHKPSAIPPGDVLIHAGDLTNLGTFDEVQEQIDWISSLPHAHKLVIAGNHDSFFDHRARRTSDVDKVIEWGQVRYLQHSSLTLTLKNRELNFYGAPQIPKCGGDEFAFQYERADDAWSGTIPMETDILITHTPPRHHLDLPLGLGCKFLLKEIWRVRPKVHVCAHVHAGHGVESLYWDNVQSIYENLSARKERGILRDLVALMAWIDVVKMVWFGSIAILWSRVWGGDSAGSIVVNAALVYRSTGTIGNAPHVINI